MDEPQEQCQNCKKMIGASKLPIHEGYCYRNIRKCEQCDEMIDVNHKQEHFDEFHKKTPCAECGTELDPKEAASHPAVCPNRKQICTYCNLDVLARELGTHTSHCGSRTRECQFCGRILKLRELDAHEAGCLEEQRRDKERKEAERAQKFKMEEMRRKEEMLRMEQMSRLEAERKEAERRKAVEDKLRQEAAEKGLKIKREEELKRKESELRNKESSRPVPTNSYQNAYEGARRAPQPAQPSYSNPQPSYTAARPGSQLGSQYGNQYKPSGYDSYLKEQTKPTTVIRSVAGETRGVTGGATKFGAGSKPAPTGPTSRYPTSQPGGNGGSLKGAGRAVLSNVEDESTKLARQLQEEYDREANAQYLARQQVKDRSKAYSRQAEDERLARELQEKMDRELAQKFAEGSPEREFEPSSRNQLPSRGGSRLDMGGYPYARQPEQYSDNIDDLFGATGGINRSGTQGSRGNPYDNPYSQGYEQPRPIPAGYYKPTTTPFDDAGGLEDDEEYQRAILESISQNKRGANRY